MAGRSCAEMDSTARPLAYQYGNYYSHNELLDFLCSCTSHLLPFRKVVKQRQVLSCPAGTSIPGETQSGSVLIQFMQRHPVSSMMQVET